MKDTSAYILQSLLERHFKNEITIKNGEAIIRCRFCGDSLKQNKAHFYIKLGSDKEAPLYHCFKCERKGLLTVDVLRSIIPDQNITQQDIEDMQLLSSSIFSKINMSKLRTGYHKISRNISYRFHPKDLDFYEKKIDYINHRLGLSMSIQEAQQNKIVGSLEELVSANQLKPTCSPWIFKDLNKYFVGFLSLDNSFLIMRNTKEDKSYMKTRYYNYELFDYKSKVQAIRNYCIPTKLNILSNEPIQVHIAEGCFDILSIFYHLNQQNRYNHIYIASNGKGYFNIAKTLLENYGLENIEFHFYPDKDVSNQELKRYIQKIIHLMYPIKIHRNIYEGEKDFGVPRDRINEIVTSIY